MNAVSSVRLCSLLAAGLVLTAVPARAQFQPRPISDPVNGERYHIEASAGFWRPLANMAITSDELGATRSEVDFKKDLGLTDQRVGEVHLVLRPAVRHKFRFQYIPIKYEQGPVIAVRDIVFNDQLYSIGLPVNSALDWKAYRFGYEYDFLVRSRGFGGFIIDFKYTDVQAALNTPFQAESVRARAPIPAVGGIFRIYPARLVSITGEITGFTLPARLIKDATGHYIDADFYGTVNFTNYVGAQVGFRSFDVDCTIDTDVGNFNLRGFYFGAVVRY